MKRFRLGAKPATSGPPVTGMWLSDDGDWVKYKDAIVQLAAVTRQRDELVEGLPSKEQGGESYHARMMNVQQSDDQYRAGVYRYLAGHRDARHACAEIAAQADADLAALREQLAGKDARIAELEAVVGELPKTADGVPVVWSDERIDLWFHEPGYPPMQDAAWDATDIASGYSTREAALAAAEHGGGE